MRSNQMGRKSNESEPTRWGYLILLLLGVVSCTMVYIFVLSAFRPSSKIESLGYQQRISKNSNSNSGSCCKGIENLEFWGSAVKWGTDFKFNSSEKCCEACKAMCTGKDGPCLCDSWVFCGNKQACGDKFGECWLKKQRDVMAPDAQESTDRVMWTSGLVFGRGEGIIGLETEHGTIHIKLLPECSPHSVAHILEMLSLRHCAGCQFYRAEGRGQTWDTRGNHIKDANFGPPFALIQGTLEAQGIIFKNIETEHCPLVRRGSVAWVGSGPEFFISLANHEEWKHAYTVFGSVLPEDMEIAEKIAELPTKSQVWNNIDVSVLEKPVPLKLHRAKSSQGELSQ